MNKKVRTSFATCWLALAWMTSATDAHPQEFWESRQVVLDASTECDDVVVAVWDTGVDTSVLSSQNIWTNLKETVDGTDSDENGYVDDVHGISFDLQERPSSRILMPLMEGVTTEELKQLAIESKGNRDFVFGVASEEAKAVIKSSMRMSKEENAEVAKRLIWFGEYAHGTSMADVCARGNPYIKILSVRQQLSHSPPMPTIEGGRARAAAYRKAVKYMQDNSVRVANLSWSRWPNLYEKALKAHGVKISEAETKQLAQQIYEIEKEVLKEVIRESPDVLFVTSAGNIGNGDGSDSLPGILDLPNLICVGAADKGGDRVVTAVKARVDVFAHGHNVIAKSPGGIEFRTMGTSISCAQVTNLAAKLLAIDPALTPTQLKSLILESATKHPKNEEMLLLHSKRAVASLQK